MPEHTGIPGQNTVFTREERAGAGSMLRQAREELGWDIYQVADALKIKPEYLDALERNSLEGLPGPAYATGFLRTYADFLNLDTEEVVRRFRAEKSALSRKPELTFPVPMTDRGIPGGGLLLTALILVVLGYGTWYYMSSGRHATPEAVEQVPADMLNPPQRSNAPPTVAAAGSGNQTPPPETGDKVPVPASAAVQPPGAENGASSSPTPATNMSVASMRPIQQSAGAASDSRPPQEPSTAMASSPSPPSADQPQAAHTYGQSAGSHIVIRATADSWVQIKEHGTPIFTRVLKAGDSYSVPDRDGLVLRTGNAGGITISSDGKDLPALGTQGQVRGNIPLDATKLGDELAE